MVYLGVGMVLYAAAGLGRAHRRRRCSCCWPASILSFYGGGFATVPAYLRDLFGTFQVGAIHGRLLTAWSAAGVAGPLIVNGFLDAQGKPGTLTAAAYQPALFTMVGVLAVGFVANLLIRPVPERFHEADATAPGATPAPRVRPRRPRTASPRRRRGPPRYRKERSMPETTPRGQAARLWISWLLVAVLLGYGVTQTAITAAKLFG